MGYDLLVFLHVSAAIVWIGSGFFMQVIVTMADRARDDDTYASLLRYNEVLGLRLFLPSSLATFVFGLLVVADGPWTLDMLWIVLALIGFAGTFLTGVLVLKPGGERLAEMLRSDGGTLGPETLHQARRLLTLARLDYVVLVAVVFDMVLKPTGDDTGALIVMALAVAGGVAFVLTRVRALDAATA